MKIHHKLLIAFSFLAALAVGVGFYSLHATKQIVRSFEGREDHFRTIIRAAAETSSFTQRAKGHLTLYLLLENSTDLEKFHDRIASLQEQLELLNRTVKIPEGREILLRMQAQTEELLAQGEKLLAIRNGDMLASGRFDLRQHPELIRKFYASCAALKEAATDLENLETDFLNKQLAITTSTELSNLAKETEGRLMLYLTLHSPEDLEQYQRGCAHLEENIELLRQRVRLPEAKELLAEMHTCTGQLQKHGQTLLASYQRGRQQDRDFVPAQHGEELHKFYTQTSRLRELGLQMATTMAELEYAKKSKALQSAAAIQRWVLLLAVAGGVLILVLGYFLSVTIAKPITRLKEAAQKIGSPGVTPEGADPRGEIAYLADSFHQIASELNEAREELLSSKEYTDNILRSMNDALFVVSPEGTLQTVNKATSQLLGYEEKDIIGKPVSDILPPQGPFRFDPDSPEKLPPLQGMEMTLRGRDNRPVPVSFSCSVMYDRQQIMEGIVCIAQDITERKRAMDELARLATVVEQAAEAIVITNPAGRIQYVNPAFEKITGYSRQEAIGLSPRLLKSGKHDKQFYQSLWQTLTTGKIWSGHFVNRRKDGSLYEEECIISPVRDLQDRIINFVALKRDVTNEKRLERQLIQSQKHEALGTLAGGIAHDLNNILTPILGYASISMASLSKKNKVYKHLERITRASERAVHLVNQILTFSRKTGHHRVPVQLQTEVREALELLRGTLPATIEIRQEIEESCSPVLANAIYLHQVIMNLCTNSYQAMRDQGGILEITLKETEVAAPLAAHAIQLPPGRYARLTISDTGCGMDKTLLTRIFEPYFTTKKTGEGTGLGLSTVHGIVKNHDGAIVVQSSPGQGTAFDLYFPVLQQPSAPEEEAQGTGRYLPRLNGKNHLLLVDDEEMVVEMGREILENIGYQVTGCASSPEALELFKAAPEHYDLVVTDQTMPGLTGVDLALALLEIRPDLPIVLITGYSEQVDEQKATALGIRSFLMKPFTPCELAKAIHRLLHQTPTNGDAEQHPPSSGHKRVAGTGRNS